ncbi:41835_t:CDS:2, partial [Gigaspora margarita]
MQLKRCLQSSVGDFESVYRKIVLQIESQARETRALISSERMKVHHAHRTSLLEPLLYRVSTFVLNKIRTEWIKVLSATPDSPLNLCTRTFESTIGLPCSHTISEHLISGQVLQQTDIHKHWWIQGRHIEFLEPTYLANNDYNDLQPLQATIYAQLEGLVNTSPVLLENPVTIKPRGRPIGAKNKNPRSVQRDPSAFEHVEKRQKQCGMCRQTGHNSRTCPN